MDITIDDIPEILLYLWDEKNAIKIKFPGNKVLRVNFIQSEQKYRYGTFNRTGGYLSYD